MNRDFLKGETWAIDLKRLDAYAIAGATPEERAAQTRLPKVKGAVAILPVFGMITQRGQDMFGGTSTMAFESAFARAMSNDRIGAVVLDIDSPGGTTSGVQEAADMVLSARDSDKPVVAVANSLAASAAYWIGSGAGKFYGAPGADVGSIGVFRAHEDVSGAMANDGVKVTFISTPEFKVEGNPFEPLSAAGLAHNRDQVDRTYEIFNRHVARGRGVSESSARENFGKGRDFKASQAAEMGLIDGVKTLKQVLSELGVGRGTGITGAISVGIEAELCQVWREGSPESTDMIGLRRKKLALRERFLV